MIFVSSSQFNANGQRMPGGGFGCLLFTILGFALVYFVLKGLYWLLYWLSPGLLVLALIINWRIFPQTIQNWFKTLQSNPVGALVYLGLAILLFPFFSLYILLKAVGLKQLERMGNQTFGQQGAPGNEGEFTEFEEIESTPKTEPRKPEPVEPPELPEKETPPGSSKEQKPDNPYDQMFD